MVFLVGVAEFDHAVEELFEGVDGPVLVGGGVDDEEPDRVDGFELSGEDVEEAEHGFDVGVHEEGVEGDEAGADLVGVLAGEPAEVFGGGDPDPREIAGAPDALDGVRIKVGVRVGFVVGGAVDEQEVYGGGTEAGFEVRSEGRGVFLGGDSEGAFAVGDAFGEQVEEEIVFAGHRWAGEQVRSGLELLNGEGVPYAVHLATFRGVCDCGGEK